MKTAQEEVDAILRAQVSGLTPNQREAVRADLSRWHGLLWSLLLDVPEQDIEVIRQGLLRVL
jgi:hypothetical protein